MAGNRRMFIAFMVLIRISSPGFGGQGPEMIDIEPIQSNLRRHLSVLTQSIGERSVRIPENLHRTAAYIQSVYEEMGLSARRESYPYNGFMVDNVVAEIACTTNPGNRYVLGAHYDSVMGTVGADDNASAVAVQLETARMLSERVGGDSLDLSVVFVSFALEEPPVFNTRAMGSRVYASRARREGERIDGMICLEMVGYSCRTPGCQHYPLPLRLFGYPETGDFIGIVGNLRSRHLTSRLATIFRKNPALPVVTLTVPLNGWVLPAVRLSDHASFWDKGFRAVMITDTAFFRNPNYHLAADTMDTLDFPFMAELVKSLMLFFQSHR